MHRIACLLALALPAACSSTPATPATDPPAITGTGQDTGGETRLGIGETVRLGDGSQLRYLRLVDDSRCPPGVQCIWAGDAEIALRWQPASGRAQELRLHSESRGGPTSATAGPHRIELLRLERGIAPHATLRIVQAD